MSMLITYDVYEDLIQISLYRNLEREHRRSPNSDVSVHLSPAVYSPPLLADERLATYEHKNSVVSLYSGTISPKNFQLG